MKQPREFDPPYDGEDCDLSITELVVVIGLFITMAFLAGVL